MNFKTILACAALLIGIGTATAAVESDIVGYQTIGVDNLGYQIISLPFAELGADDAGYPIQSIEGTLSQHNANARADALMVMDPTTKGYTTYRYKVGGWVKDGETAPTTDVIPLGASVFIKKAVKAGEVLISGRVLTDETASVELSIGYNLVSNPYPVEIKIADIKGSLSAHASDVRADKVMTFNPTTKAYTTYQLRSIGWVKDGESTVTTDTIAAGEGFFFKKAVKAGTLTFTRPF